MAATYLNCWAIGPAHLITNTDALECLTCSTPVTEDHFCEGCGEAVCAKCRIVIHGQPHCSKCVADLRTGRC